MVNEEQIADRVRNLAMHLIQWNNINRSTCGCAHAQSYTPKKLHLLFVSGGSPRLVHWNGQQCCENQGRVAVQSRIGLAADFYFSKARMEPHLVCVCVCVCVRSCVNCRQTTRTAVQLRDVYVCVPRMKRNTKNANGCPWTGTRILPRESIFGTKS
jgi:hypothetical protein